MVSGWFRPFIPLDAHFGVHVFSFDETDVTRLTLENSKHGERGTLTTHGFSTEADRQNERMLQRGLTLIMDDFGIAEQKRVVLIQEDTRMKVVTFDVTHSILKVGYIEVVAVPKKVVTLEGYLAVEATNYIHEGDIKEVNAIHVKIHDMGCKPLTFYGMTETEKGDN